MYEAVFLFDFLSLSPASFRAFSHSLSLALVSRLVYAISFHLPFVMC